MQGDGAQQSPGHGACHHTHAETSAHEPEVASPIFPIGDVGDIGASNRTCGAGDAGHDASGVEEVAYFWQFQMIFRLLWFVRATI